LNRGERSVLNPEKSILQSIPDTDKIRQRMAQLAREQAILKKLLRLAREKDEATQSNQELQGGRR
jgi:hypothetical protein